MASALLFEHLELLFAKAISYITFACMIITCFDKKKGQLMFM